MLFPPDIITILSQRNPGKMHIDFSWTSTPTMLVHPQHVTAKAVSLLAFAMVSVGLQKPQRPVLMAS